jgi:hypothetical protein
MTNTNESIDEKLVRLRGDTEDLLPRADFCASVMSRVASAEKRGTAEDWTASVLYLSRVGMLVATLAAAAFVVVAWDSVSSAEQEEALGYGVVEAFQ